MPDNLRSTLYEVADRAGRPLPDPLKLQRLTEALAELYDGLRMALRAGTADALDVVNRKVRQAQENSKRELLGFLERDELLAFLDATHGLERLPNAAYWARADGTPTLTAEQIFDKGTTQSVTHPPEIGIVKVVTADFRKIAIGFFSPARLGDMAAQASEEIAARWGWIGLHRVVEVLKQAKGDAAWHEIETALRLKELHARCIADGVTKEFEPHWLDFLVRDFVARSEAPETRGVLWFDREKAWRKAGRPPDRAAVPIPDRAEEIFVRIKRCAELWPDCSWAEFAGLANSISETSPTDKPGGDRFPTRRLELRRRGPVPTGDKIKTAAKRLLEAGKVPGQTITWKVFHTEICQELNVEHGQRGYSQDTVEVAVRPLLASKTGIGESTGN